MLDKYRFSNTGDKKDGDTIYLNPRFNIEDNFQRSVLFHELVHTNQDVEYASKGYFEKLRTITPQSVQVRQDIQQLEKALPILKEQITERIQNIETYRHYFNDPVDSGALRTHRHVH